MPRHLALIALSAILVTPALAFDEEPDPADLVRAKFSQSAFARLSPSDLYDVRLALKRGRTITILGCSPSQSRAVFRASFDQNAPAVGVLRTTCGG